MTPDLKSYDFIVVNTSAGKDSQAMLNVVCQAAKKAGVLHKVVAVHADLGRCEWQGVKELAAEQAAFYGVRFEVVRNGERDLLEEVKQRGMWPGAKTRFCTSSHKRDQIKKLLVKLGQEAGGKPGKQGKQVRVLNCLGMRADESPNRAKELPFEEKAEGSCQYRQVDRWLPIHEWNVNQVWWEIMRAGTRHHWAYDEGMPRLSCVFCVFAPKSALMTAGRLNPELLDQYVQVELEIGHRFKKDLSIQSIQDALRQGEGVGQVERWAA